MTEFELIRIIIEASILLFMAGKFVQSQKSLEGELREIKQNLKEINGTVRCHDRDLAVAKNQIEVLLVRTAALTDR